LTYTNFGVFDFSRLAVTDWRLRRWRLWFLALSNAPRLFRQYTSTTCYLLVLVPQPSQHICAAGCLIGHRYATFIWWRGVKLIHSASRRTGNIQKFPVYILSRWRLLWMPLMMSINKAWLTISQRVSKAKFVGLCESPDFSDCLYSGPQKWWPLLPLEIYGSRVKTYVVLCIQG